MIIKSIFRRHERWSPVHPSMGTFWGMGIGIGCGVGWGPGFGPEVVGYVGAGCGVGFSVGVTLAGIGVGLPQNGLVQALYNAIAANNTSLEFARSHRLTAQKTVLDESLNDATTHVSFSRKETRSRVSSLQGDVKCMGRFELNKLDMAVSNQIQSTLECLGAFRDKLWPPGGEP